MYALTAHLTLSVVLASLVQCSPSRVYERATFITTTADLLPEYDYVVLGGGTSALTVADRLTENNDGTTVLVIEYGPVDSGDGGTTNPGLPVPTKYTRNYQSIPQKGLNGRTSPAYTGAVVGGGTVVNAMLFNRGSKVDYDSWVKLGNPGWGWDDLLPYFKKATTFHPPPADIKAQYPISDDPAPHGFTGPVGASFPVFQYPVIKNFYKGWNQIGVQSNPQPNAGFPNGAFYSTISIDFNNQSRSSASSAHYKPLVGKRKQYDLITGQTVTKLHFSKSKCKIKGATFTPNNGGANFTIKAKKEYLLAAGAIHSPQILLLSGIGPKNLLEGLGIKVKLELPVGHNFHDQPTIFLTLNYTNFNGPDPNTLFTDQNYAAQQLALYDAKRQGAYTIPYIGGTAVTYLGLPQVTDDFQKIIQSVQGFDVTTLAPNGSDPAIAAGLKKQAEILLEDLANPVLTVSETAFGGGTTVPLAFVKPLSRGSISINTTDPYAAPVIDYQTFSNPVDIKVAVASFKKTREFFNAPALKGDLGAVEANPGVTVTSDSDIEQAIRNQAVGTWAHPVGSLPMMKKKYGGIVDPTLKVYGIKNLRVIDASMVPMIPGTHTSWMVYAVAEKAADLIKADKNNS